jgi:hypothetical protein
MRMDSKERLESFAQVSTCSTVEYRGDMQSEEMVLNVVQMVVHVSLWLRKPRGLIAN